MNCAIITASIDDAEHFLPKHKEKKSSRPTRLTSERHGPGAFLVLVRARCFCSTKLSCSSIHLIVPPIGFA